MNHPTIYILRSSPHNEEFLLKNGYALNEKDIISIAESHVKEYYAMDYNRVTSVVDWVKYTITVTVIDDDGFDSNHEYHISRITHVDSPV